MFSTGEPQKDVATLDNYPALKLHNKRGEEGAGKENVHAEDEGSAAVTV